VDVGQRQMYRLLLEPIADLGQPELGENLQRRHVEIAVVKERRELRHVSNQKPAILTDAVAADRRGAMIDVLPDEFERLPLCFLLGDVAGAHPLGQPRVRMLASVPFIHRTQMIVRLVDGENGPLGEHRQFLVRNDGRDLDDAVLLGDEPRHLEIDPNQVVFATHSNP